MKFTGKIDREKKEEVEEVHEVHEEVIETITIPDIIDEKKDVKGKVAERVEGLRNIKNSKEGGKIFCIPFDQYPKMATSVPGIVPGMITMITAASGVGKTQFAKAIAVRAPLEYAAKHNIDLKIFYFALEESKQEFIDSMICNFISIKCKVNIDILMLQGFRSESLPDNLMNLIEMHMPKIEAMLDKVEIIDSVYNPTGIYKYCRDFADRNGEHVYEERVFIKRTTDEKTGKRKEEEEKVQVYSHYIPNNPNQIVICIVDHMSLLTPEGDDNLHSTMAKWSTNYCLKQLTKHWNWACVNIIQQEQTGEKEQFANSGESILKKTEPSLSSFANNKEIQRDAKVVFGVYSPDRYGAEHYHDYTINSNNGSFIGFRDAFRAVKVLKRFG